MAKQPTALIILDGFANRESEHGNAVKQAHKPNFDRYYNTYCLLYTSDAADE